MQTKFTASYVVDSDKIIPFAKLILWQEKVLSDDTPEARLIDNPESAVDYISRMANELLTNWMAQFVNMQIDEQTKETTANIQASKKAAIKEVSEGITITVNEN